MSKCAWYCELELGHPGKHKSWVRSVRLMVDGECKTGDELIRAEQEAKSEEPKSEKRG